MAGFAGVDADAVVLGEVVDAAAVVVAVLVALVILTTVMAGAFSVLD